MLPGGGQGGVGGGGERPSYGPGARFAWSGGEGDVSCAYVSMTHVGGSGDNFKKQNQDAYFVARPADGKSVVWGVLDGHGPDNGRLAAQTAASAFTEWFEAHMDEVAATPQASMSAAFKHAHDAIRAAIVKKYADRGQPLEETPEGFFLEEDGQPADGGTTASVVALLQGHLLIVANVGDSDCLLGGVLPDGSIGFEQLCADHTAMSVDEYIRVARLTEERPDDWEPALFVYDGDPDDLLEVFAVSDEGSVAVDPELAEQLDELGIGYKSTRGDRATAIVVPETERYGQQKLGMTRSLGDFYMQHHGCTYEPAVSCIDLFDLVAQLSQVTLILASDGLWDVWNYKDVLKYPLRAAPSGGGGGGDFSTALLDATELAGHMDDLMSETRAESFELFEESADNITAVCVAFDSIVPRDGS